MNSSVSISRNYINCFQCNSAYHCKYRYKFTIEKFCINLFVVQNWNNMQHFPYIRQNMQILLIWLTSHKLINIYILDFFILIQVLKLFIQWVFPFLYVPYYLLHHKCNASFLSQIPSVVVKIHSIVVPLHVENCIPTHRWYEITLHIKEHFNTTTRFS